eukprot:CAMPEP_0113572770 /NCGR_PEP_ID=MMETSP0015_2-20120614/26267_1 /TAXON_ID=2838 /ORGANISM="Odontella" /LENGTH=160 /DNA_ID=CAMNT_0000475815 /DNA_START=422 /DNA_END=905 /DNA_ORIENTATION=- /assembly_acc=CAM_ASM_000160
MMKISSTENRNAIVAEFTNWVFQDKSPDTKCRLGQIRWLAGCQRGGLRACLQSPFRMRVHMPNHSVQGEDGPSQRVLQRVMWRLYSLSVNLATLGSEKKTPPLLFASSFPLGLLRLMPFVLPYALLYYRLHTMVQVDKAATQYELANYRGGDQREGIGPV